MMRVSQQRILISGVVGVFLSTLMHFTTTLDHRLQDYFFQADRWWIDENAEPFRTLLYRAPKIGLVLLIGLVAALAIRAWYRPEKWSALTVLAYLALTPLLTNALKSSIPQACPKDLVQYGGSISANVWGQLQNPEKCFPGAHVSTAVAWLGVFFLLKQERYRRLFGWAFVLYFFVIAFYQTAKGAHFISDNLATLSLGAILFVLLQKNLERLEQKTQNR